MDSFTESASKPRHVDVTFLSPKSDPGGHQANYPTYRDSPSRLHFFLCQSHSSDLPVGVSVACFFTSSTGGPQLYL